MSDVLKDLANQFNNIYSEGNWLGETFTSVLDDVPQHIAFKKPEHSNNSIAAIIHHIIEWREFFFRKFEDDKNYDVDQDASFNVSEYKYASGGWQQLLIEFENTQKRMTEILINAEDELLNRPVGARKYTMGYLIRGLIEHDLYHLGQINLLKKQLS